MMREGEKPWIDKEEVSKVHNRDWRRQIIVTKPQAWRGYGGIKWKNAPDIRK